MADAIQYFIHFLGASLWVGPQLYIIISFAPALRLIDSPSLRRRATEVMTYRYGILSWAGLFMLIGTGFFNWRDFAGSWGNLFPMLNDSRFGYVLLAKLIIVLTIVVISAFHTFYTGPKLLRLMPQSEHETPSPEYGRLRRLSVILSAKVLLLSLTALFLGPLLRWWA